MPWFESIITGATFPPRQAVAAGLLDEVVQGHETLISESIRIARELGDLATPAFSAMKRVARGTVADHVRLERSRL
jgi:enoyl-CoA hydratase/carnithine racemase